MIEGGLAVMIEQRRGGGDDRERGRVKVMVERERGVEVMIESERKGNGRIEKGWR